ncbi:glycosyltransferase family 4 protein [Acidimicrobiia bacterium]|nr:glycosyltransferase family 4 protein [Acidimicrobiia bacterium]
MKKILLIHTRYRNFGGEDAAVENEINLLERHYEVKTIYFTNSISNYFYDFTAFITTRNKSSINKLQQEINNFKPDIAYVHNTWFKASLGVFSILKSNNIQIILKLHNFRYRCSRTYTAKGHFVNSNFCLACGLEKGKLQIFNKYYSESYFKSIFLIRYGKKYFELLKKYNLKILVLTYFHKDDLSSSGINESKIKIFPNYLSEDNDSKYNPSSKYLIYAGRISKEKGVQELIEAFLEMDNDELVLKIIGAGPELINLKTKFDSKNILFLGEMKNKEVICEIRKSRAVITATKLLEGQPTLLCEASVNGIPSIFPKSGGIGEFFTDDYKLSFEQFDYYELKEKLALLENSELLKKIGKDNKKYITEYLDEKKLIKEFEEMMPNNV